MSIAKSNLEGGLLYKIIFFLWRKIKKFFFCFYKQVSIFCFANSLMENRLKSNKTPKNCQKGEEKKNKKFSVEVQRRKNVHPKGQGGNWAT